MHKWLLPLALLIAADANAASMARAPLTLLGSLAGGVVGGAAGMGIYGALDPYGSDDGLEWMLMGAPIGFGLGAALGGTITHTIVGGPRPGRVLLLSGGLGVIAGGLVVVTPLLYDNYDESWFVASWVGGLALAVAGVPTAAALTSMAVSKRVPLVTLIPMVDRRSSGMAVVGRF